MTDNQTIIAYFLFCYIRYTEQKENVKNTNFMKIKKEKETGTFFFPH
jgi:hypothetical protein